MDPLSIAAIGWLMSALVSKAVTALLEAWAKRNDLGNEFKTLKDQLVQLCALLENYHSIRTNNRFLEELVQELQQLAYQAENLLDELDYYRLEDEVHYYWLKDEHQHRGTQEQVSSNNTSSVASSSSSFRLASRSILSTLKGMSCRSAVDVQVPVPKTFPSRISLSGRMKDLAKQLQNSKEKVRNAVQTELQAITAQNTGISQTSSLLTEPRVLERGQTSSFLIEPIVFGRDQERDKLVNLLTIEKSAIIGKVPVLAIVGSGGVGKTTLARLVFNNPKVQSNFEIKLWICVSTRFDIERLTREMLECASGKGYYKVTNLFVLQNKLKDELVSKRFLLVLDDMWEEDDESQWHSMIAPLNCCMVKGSIILVTTRKKSVAKMVNAREIYLQGLDNETFLSFFSTCIFNDPNFQGNQMLKNIGQQIANKLKGNPLAAKTVSALLKDNPATAHWMAIRDNEQWKSQSGPNDIMPALRLSYEHMPFHLQRCFSYCAMFPEDHHFTRKEMVYLWMAQSFLDVISVDIGSNYFNHLVNRGFFQIKQSTYDDKEYYTFHDLIHDLAHEVAFKECLTINGPEPRKIPCPPTIRHMSISYTWESKEAELEQAMVRALPCLEGDNLSTILLISWEEFPSGTFQGILDLLKKAKFLHALRLNLCSMVQPHNFNFQNFVSLRYLRLSCSDNTRNTLPREICKLYHLEVFEIENGWNLVELPNNFSNLVSLRYFIVGEKLYSETWGELTTLHSMIRGVGKLTSLQELNHFDVQQKMGFEIEQLGSLKEIGGSLHISNLENVYTEREANKARLAEKEKLDALYLKWNHGKEKLDIALYLKWNHGEQEHKGVLEGLKPNSNLKLLEIRGYGGRASPTWLDPSLIFLESLTLEDCYALEVLPPIGELECLKHLKLSKLAVREIGHQCYGTRQSMKFPSLEVLKIMHMPDLKKWVWTDQLQQFLCFKKLKVLEIHRCYELVDFPLSGCATSEVLKRFPSLETLIIEDCSRIILPPLPYSSMLSYISIDMSGFIYLMVYQKEVNLDRLKFSLTLNKCSSIEVGEVLAFHDLSSLRVLKIFFISDLESLDLQSFVFLEDLDIMQCGSLISLTFGEHLVHLRSLKIRSCENLCLMKGLKSWVNMKELQFRECPGFIAAWDSASKEIQGTEPGFFLSLRRIEGDSLSLLTLPICKLLTGLQYFNLEVSAKEHEVSLQLLTSINLIDIRGRKNLQSFPFDLFPSLKTLWITFPSIKNVPTNSSTDEIIKGCLKLRNIQQVNIYGDPFQIRFELSLEEMIQQADGCS